MTPVSDTKLTRKDTTLDLSKKAKKRYALVSLKRLLSVPKSHTSHDMQIQKT